MEAAQVSDGNDPPRSESASPAGGIDIDAFRRGEQFEVVLEQFDRLIYSVARRYAIDGDQRDDMYQEICIRIYERCDTFRGGSLGAWIHRIAENICRNRLRAGESRRAATERYASAHPNGLPPSGAPTDPLEHVVSVESAERIGEALAQLSRRQADVFVLIRIEGYTPRDVAKIMDIKEATVRSNLRHATNKLREFLKEER